MTLEAMSIRQLQLWLIFSVVVAGKSAKFAEAVILRFVGCLTGRELPFEYFGRLGDAELDSLVRGIRTGNYSKTTNAFRCMATKKLDLLKCSIEDLEGIPGVGPKTSRFFIIKTRPWVRCAVLDVHILRWMRANGYPDAPRNTPQNKRLYAYFEKAFLDECDKRQKSPFDFDFEIWAKGAKYQE